MRVRASDHCLMRWRERIDPEANRKIIRETVLASIPVESDGEYAAFWNVEHECRILCVRERRKRPNGAYRTQSCGNRFIVKTVIKGKRDPFDFQAEEAADA